jgi:hypothetical protein
MLCEMQAMRRSIADMIRFIVCTCRYMIIVAMRVDVCVNQ